MPPSSHAEGDPIHLKEDRYIFPSPHITLKDLLAEYLALCMAAKMIKRTANLAL